jgi:hypothetical protein
MEFPIALALVSLLAATLLSTVLSRRAELPRQTDLATLAAHAVLAQERAAPVPLCPTLTPAQWLHLESQLPRWKRPQFEVARKRYNELRKSFSRSDLSGELYYPNPAEMVGAAHDLLMLIARH